MKKTALHLSGVMLLTLAFASAQRTTIAPSGLALPVAIAKGGTGTASTLTGLVRGSASAMTAAELSGGCVTSGSNVTTCIPAMTAAQTTAYQVLASDFPAAGCGTVPITSGTFAVTLVASTSQPASGRCLWIINYGTGIPTLTRSGQLINGVAANLIGTAGSSTAPTGWYVISDGTNYTAQSFGGGGGGGVTCSGGKATVGTCLLDYQKQAAASTGDGTDKTLYTTTVAANTFGAAQCLRVAVGWKLSATTATYKIWYGATSFLIYAAAGSTGELTFEGFICNDPGLTNSQQFSSGFQLTVPTQILFLNGVGSNSTQTSAIDSTLSQVLKFSFNTASPNTVTGLWWKVVVEK